MFALKNMDDLWDHIAYVTLYAPNDFPYRDFVPEGEQMNLDRAFEQLREGVEIAFPGEYYPEKKAPLYAILERAWDAYKGGDRLKGANLLHEFQSGIFKEG